MTRSNTAGQPWFKLSISYQDDEKILKVSANAELLFVRVLAVCHGTSSNGRASAEQVQRCGRGMRNVRGCCVELVQAGLWRCVDNGSAYVVAAFGKWGGDAANGESVSAAQYPKRQTPAGGKGGRAPAAPPAREEKERERERESFRSPPGSDRNDSAQPAPRSAEGAAQPAPDDVDAGGDTVSFEDPKAAARRLAEEGQRRNKMSTGRNAALRNTEWNKRRVERHSTEPTFAEMDRIIAEQQSNGGAVE